MGGRDGGRPAGALPERPELLMLLSVGALLISGGTLAALHLLLQPGGSGSKGTGRPSTAAAKEEQAAEEAAGLESIAQYDLERPLDEELALALSDPEPEKEETGQDAQPPSSIQEEQAQEAGASAGEYTHPNGKKLSRRARSRRRRQEQLVGPHIETFPQQERGRMMVQIGLQRKEESAAASNKCTVCWMTERHCICEKLPSLSLPVDFVVLLHYKEYMRISNTGHLLPLMHKRDVATNIGSELLIKGVEASEARLAALEAQAQHEPYSVIALMPSDDAVSLHDVLRRRQEAGTDGGRLKVILLDGTWRQGRALNRRLSPHVTRVKLAVVDRPSHFRLRRRTRADGICTIEAAALTVVELGEQNGERYDGVIEALNLLNESVVKSTNKPPKDDQNLFGKKWGKGAWGTTRRPPLSPLRQPVAGGGHDASFLEEEEEEEEEEDFADSQSSLDGDGDGDGEEGQAEDDGLMVSS